MRVRRLPLQGTWSFYAACTPRGDCQLADFLENLDDRYRKSADGLLSRFEHIAKTGPSRNASWCHQLRGDIWEFIKGDIRVLYFCHEGKVIVCSHALIKSSQKIKKADIDKAEAAFNAYSEAVRNGSLIVDEENEDGE